MGTAVIFHLEGSNWLFLTIRIRGIRGRCMSDVVCIAVIFFVRGVGTGEFGENSEQQLCVIREIRASVIQGNGDS